MHEFQSAGIGKCSLCHLCRHTNLFRDIYRNALKTVISMLNIVSVKCNMTGIYWKLRSSTWYTQAVMPLEVTKVPCQNSFVNLHNRNNQLLCFV